MSLIEQLGTDLETTTALLTDWISRASASRDRLAEQDAQVRKRHEELSGAATRARAQAAELAQGGRTCSTTAQREITSVTEQGAKSSRDAGSGATRLEGDSRVFDEAGAQLQEVLRTGRSRVSGLAADARTGFGAAGTARQALAEGLARSHTQARAGLDEMKSILRGHAAQLTERGQELQGQIQSHVGELDGALTARASATYESCVHFLGGEFRTEITRRIEALSASSGDQVRSLAKQDVVVVRNGVIDGLNACLRDTQEIARGVPEKLEREGQAALRNGVSELGTRVLAGVVSSVVESAVTTTACADKMPILNSINVGLDLALMALREMDS